MDSSESVAGLTWAEQSIAAAGDSYLDQLTSMAERALAHRVVLEYLGEDDAAREHAVLVEALCVIIDRRRRAAGLSTTADEVI